MPEVRDYWNPVQSAFLLADAAKWPYVDLEEAVRAGKTTPLVAKAANYCVDYPASTGRCVGGRRTRTTRS